MNATETIAKFAEAYTATIETIRNHEDFFCSNEFNEAMTDDFEKLFELADEALNLFEADDNRPTCMIESRELKTVRRALEGFIRVSHENRLSDGLDEECIMHWSDISSNEDVCDALECFLRNLKFMADRFDMTNTMAQA